MGLIDDLKVGTPQAPWQMCAVKWALQLTDGADHDALVAAINDPQVSSLRIAQVVRHHLGINFNHGSVRRHRRGECRCPR